MTSLRCSLPQPVQQQPEEPAEGDYVEEEGAEGAEGGDGPSSTTTEASKGKRVGNGVLRPFRSNQDLIETLKRRRQQASAGGPVITLHTTSSTTARPEPVNNSESPTDSSLTK